MAEMVFCQSCNTVVWAYDHQPHMDIRGLMNMLNMPCPKCGDTGNFDGYYRDGDWLALHDAVKLHKETEGVELKWEISPDCAWFKRPGHTPEDYKKLMEEIVKIIRFNSIPAPEI